MFHLPPSFSLTLYKRYSRYTFSQFWQRKPISYTISSAVPPTMLSLPATFNSPFYLQVIGDKTTILQRTELNENKKEVKNYCQTRCRWMPFTYITLYWEARKTQVGGRAVNDIFKCMPFTRRDVRFPIS